MPLILPQRFSASFVTRTFYPYEYKHKCRDEINMGQCYDWAYIAYCLWANVELWTSDYHAWVKVGTKFYDSETFNGDPDLKKLGCNRRCGWGEVEPMQVSAHKFKVIWDTYGHPNHEWDLQVEKITKLGLNIVRK